MDVFLRLVAVLAFAVVAATACGAPRGGERTNSRSSHRSGSDSRVIGADPYASDWRVGAVESRRLAIE